jgi:hypothetical protein
MDMRRLIVLAVVGLAILFGPLPQAGADVKDKSAPSPSSCGSFGTKVEFVATPSEAARRALKEEKLVFVLHISGHFEDPGLT